MTCNENVFLRVNLIFEFALILFSILLNPSIFIIHVYLLFILNVKYNLSNGIYPSYLLIIWLLYLI